MYAPQTDEQGVNCIFYENQANSFFFVYFFLLPCLTTKSSVMSVPPFFVAVVNKNTTFARRNDPVHSEKDIRNQ